MGHNGYIASYSPENILKQIFLLQNVFFPAAGKFWWVGGWDTIWLSDEGRLFKAAKGIRGKGAMWGIKPKVEAGSATPFT